MLGAGRAQALATADRVGLPKREGVPSSCPTEWVEGVCPRRRRKKGALHRRLATTQARSSPPDFGRAPKKNYFFSLFFRSVNVSSHPVTRCTAAPKTIQPPSFSANPLNSPPSPSVRPPGRPSVESPADSPGGALLPQPLYRLFVRAPSSHRLPDSATHRTTFSRPPPSSSSRSSNAEPPCTRHRLVFFLILLYCFFAFT